MKRWPILFGGLLSLVAKVAFATTIFLTGSGNWTVPSDFSSGTVEVIGAGGAGSGTTNIGGGGGAYSKKNLALFAPGVSVPYSAGVGVVSGADGADTWFSSTSYLLAKGGKGGDNTGQGGQAAGGVGDVKYSGGDSGSATGGGGAAGPFGAGGNGVACGTGTGGSGDAGHGGAGGNPGLSGGNGTEWDASHGSGGGGGAGCNPVARANGGQYGGGAGGADWAAGGSTLSGDGLIVIIYTPLVRHRVSTSVF